MTFDAPHGRFARATLAVALALLCVHAAHAALGADLVPLIDEWLPSAISACATAACVARVLAGDRERAAWVLIALGLGSWTVGGVLFVGLHSDGGAPEPSIADAFFLGLYPALAIALLLLVRRHLRDVRLWLDGLVAGLTLVATAIAIAFTELEIAGLGGSYQLPATLAYVVGDLMLLGFVTAVFTVTGFRPGRRFGLLGGGLALAAVVDTLFTYQLAVGTYELGTAVDSLWPAALLLIAASVWARPASPPAGDGGRLPAFVAASAFTLTGIALVAIDHYVHMPELVIWLVVPAMVARAVRTLLTFVDMSRAVCAAQAAAALVESSDDAIFQSARDGTVLSWNPGAVRTFGRPPEAVVGRRLTDLVAPDSAGTLADLVAAAAAGRPAGDTLTGVRGDGATIDVTISLSPIRDAGGRVIGLSVMAHDITELRAAEAAQRASEAKSRFLSRMSHELRTPLNAVLGFGQLLAMRDLDREAREEIDHILKAGDHLLKLINETLEIAHIESGRLALTIEPVEVAPVVEEVVGLIAPLSAARDVAVAVDAGSLDGWVTADRQRLKQALLNLLSNAIKFNRYGGRVAIRCERAGDRLAIAVADTGIGIEASDMPRLFSPFERLRTGADDVEGSGLGLAVSRGLVEAMDGTLTAASEPGTGSTFTVELPVAEPAAIAPLEPRAAALPRLAAGGERDGDTRTVLYVEDNRSNVQLMEQIFAACDDLELVTAEDGEQGLAMARAVGPDLILLDLNLPGIDGDEVLDRLRADVATHAIPAIVVSADATAAQIDAVLARGALDYLTKPIDIGRLMDAIDDALVGAPKG